MVYRSRLDADGGVMAMSGLIKETADNAMHIQA